MAERSKISRRIDALYIGKSTVFKTFLLAGIVVISAVFVWYTFDVIGQLQHDTREQVEKYVKLWEMAANSPTSGSELQFIFDEIVVKANFPIVVLDNAREPIHWRNIEGVEPSDISAETLEKLRHEAQHMTEQGQEFPLRFGETNLNYFCYGDSKVINQLRMMPFIEIGIVIAFMLLGLIGFQNIRRSEERHIWVGMAKETAHQLGTPITSLMGWLEVAEGECSPSEGREESDLLEETIDNMKADVERLQRIANRFGQIGSVPELKPYDLNELIGEAIDYYRRRLPFEGHGVRMDYHSVSLPKIDLNAELLSWALENLIKNALQAVDSKTGLVDIRTELFASREEVTVYVTDNGKGITPAAARKIFRAGFTTKKRGWGLGLTLVKRIVEEYHGGRVSLDSSRPGETVFELTLPLRCSTLDDQKRG